MEGKRKPLGALLKKQGLLTEQELQFALTEQKATGEKLGECLLRLGIITDAELAFALAKQTDVPFIDLKSFSPDKEAIRKIPAHIARTQKILPLRMNGNQMEVATADPYDINVSQIILRATGLVARLFVGAKGEIEKLVERHYYLIEHPIDEDISKAINLLSQRPGAEIDVSSLTDLILTSAVIQRATDVHITPSDRSCRIMFRIDGVLDARYVFPHQIHNKLITNLKVKAGMDISEQRKPQDGRMSFEFLGDSFDVRVSTVKTNFGENMVLRLLPSKGESLLNLEQLGFGKEQLSQIESLFSKPFGMVLVTGPTGSGKTTTLYAALRRQNAIEKNIVTVEDPIEYQFLMIRQTQVNAKAGYTFASAIRTFLRQDPDVILVGEIRDSETASLATRAAITGHLVLSTLHTNSAIGAVARLKDLEISPYLLSTSLSGIIAQRLVRRLCPYCKVPSRPTEFESSYFDIPPEREIFRRGSCNQCRNTGYMGRTVVAEVLGFSGKMLKKIASDEPISEILSQARSEGFSPLKTQARQKILDGVTSPEEVRRVVG